MKPGPTIHYRRPGLRLLLLPVLLAVVLLAARGLGTRLPSGGQLAFSGYMSTATLDIFLLDVGTRHIVNLTRSDDAYERRPAWSADGAALVYAWAREQERRAEVRDIPHGRLQSVPAGAWAVGLAVPEPVFTPDGSALILLNEDFRQVDLDSSRAVEAGDPIGGAHDIAPDGVRVVAALPDQDGIYRIGLAAAQDAPFSLITPPGISFYEPSWSPDGQQVAALRAQAGRYEVVVLEIGCLPGCVPVVRALVAGARLESSPDWAADGRIAYECLVGGRSQLCLVNADGSDARRLTNLAPGMLARHPAWRP